MATKKQPISKKTTKKPKTQQSKPAIKSPYRKKPLSPISLEIVCILVIAFCLFLTICLFANGSGGAFGKFLSLFFVGMFGIGGFLSPFIGISVCIYLMFSKIKSIRNVNIILGTVLFITFISFMHALTVDSSYKPSGIFDYLTTSYMNASAVNGGVIGAIVGNFMLTILGKIGTYIFLGTLTIVFFIVLSGRSVIAGITNLDFSNLRNIMSNDDEYDEYGDEYDEDDVFMEEIPVKTQRSARPSNIELRKRKLKPKVELSEEAKIIKSKIVSDELKLFDIDETTPSDKNILLMKDEFVKKASKKQNEQIEIDFNKKIEQFENIPLHPVRGEIRPELRPESISDIKLMGFGEDDERSAEVANYVNEVIERTNNNYENKELDNQKTNMSQTDSDDLVDKQFEVELKKLSNIEKNNIELANDKSDEFVEENNTLDNSTNNYNLEYEEGYSDTYVVVDDYEDDFDDFEYIRDGEFKEPVFVDTSRMFESFPKARAMKNGFITNKSIEITDSNDNLLAKNDFDGFENKNTEKYDQNEHETTFVNSAIRETSNVDNNLNSPNLDVLNNESSNFKNNNYIEANDINNNADNLHDYIQNNHQNNVQSEKTPERTIDRLSDEEREKERERILEMQEIERKKIVEMKRKELELQEEALKNKKSMEQINTIRQANSMLEKKAYIFPPINLLRRNPNPNSSMSKAEVLENSKKLEETLQSFGVSAKVIEVSKGPAITRYELSPGPGVKVSKISNLADDLALNLAAAGIRIEAPIPGKAAVGIEVPNKIVDMVALEEVLSDEAFKIFPSKLAFGLGKDVAGKTVVADIAKMPHMLIAGATGSGKSVCINTLITSIIYKSTPDEVKLLMIDPKVVELSIYNGIPHLLIPVVTDPKKAAGALNWAVQEMVTRYNLFAESATRDLAGYNNYVKEQGNKEILPQIVIIIDELADLMMAAPGEVEDAICRLAQMARAAGLHLIIATQRPSVDVITGVIKANIPSRLAFAVSSGIDSRTILDTVGAEKLLGKGDMLFYPAGMAKPVRVQGAFISDKEVEAIVNFVKDDKSVEYDQDVIDKITGSTKMAEVNDDVDEYFEDAIMFIIEKEKASASMLQRQFRIGYNRAARLVEDLEARGIVGKEDGSKPRKVLMTMSEFENYRNGVPDEIL